MRCYVLLFGHFCYGRYKDFESNEFGNVRIVLDEKVLHGLSVRMWLNA